jgi:hypothetical protein
VFIPPIWDNESQRIGKQRCTPLGYGLHILSDLIGVTGLLVLLGSLCFIAYQAAHDAFTLPLLWFVAAAVAIGVVGRMLLHYSWHLAFRKGFRYDQKLRQTTWFENGQQLSLPVET